MKPFKINLNSRKNYHNTKLKIKTLHFDAIDKLNSKIIVSSLIRSTVAEQFQKRFYKYWFCMDAIYGSFQGLV